MTTDTTMTTTTGISLARLVSSPANVRRTGIGTGIKGLAASIEAHGLLQSLVVRPSPTGAGRFEVVAGGRRLAALKLLAKQKRLAKGIIIPCRVLEDGDGTDGVEASLAENTVRQDMHPADQFEAFHALHARGIGIEDIAARFGVSAHTVRQRLRLASISLALIQAYRDGALTLDHLPALADSPARQALAVAEAEWRGKLPEDQTALWGWLLAQDEATVLALLAACMARGVDAGAADWTTPDQADCLPAKVAQAAGLDLRQSWTATRDSYLGRVPKALIIEAVAEGAGPGVAHRLAGAKKDAMVADAVQLLAGTGWLPAMLRVPVAADAMTMAAE